MDTLYNQALNIMTDTFRMLEGRVPPPQRVPHMDSFAFRYIEKTIHQAMVQKLARVISGLHAARLLMEKGFVQEQAALQRMLDEFHEDITFLSYAVIFNNRIPLHQKYLDAFYEEEFDAPSAIESTQKRLMVKRTKIRAYIAQVSGPGLDPSTGVEAARTLSKTYSGYVHGASPQIMDMFGGNPPHFHVNGMRGTPLQEEHQHDLWNYFFRSIISFALVAKAFGDEELFRSLYDYHIEFDRQSGRNNTVQNADET